MSNESKITGKTPASSKRLEESEHSRLKARIEHLEKCAGENASLKIENSILRSKIAGLETDVQLASNRAENMSRRAAMARNMVHELVDLLMIDRDKRN